LTRSVPFPSLLAHAHLLADAAGKAIRPHFRKTLAVDDKGGAMGFDPVTIADQAAERVIARHLARTFPDHGIVGEEFGVTRPGARYRWVIDPIDGTRAFIMGLPTWGTLIGLMDGDIPLLGMMDQPFTGERFWSGAKTSHLRTAGGKTQRLRTRACPKLDAAIFSTTHPDYFKPGRGARILAALKSQTRMTRYGGDCYAYCLLAAGHIDIVVETDLKPYDIVALIPIIERAGGKITSFDGGSAASGGNVIACGDPALHAEVMALIANA
jgi:myo-inositol-1(or 4)-monophosphatase